MSSGRTAVFALAAMLSSAGAFAANTVTAPIASYNMAAINAAHGIVTVPFGTTIGTPAYVVDSGSQLVAGSQFTVGLPAGFLFHSAPVLTVSTGSASLTSGGIGSNTAVFTIGSTVAGGSTVSLTAFSVSGADQLQFFTPSSNPLPMTFQASLLDAQPLHAGVFANSLAVLPDFRLGGGTIDMQSPTLGLAFGNNPLTDVPTGLIGYLALAEPQVDEINPSIPLLNPDGTLATLIPGETATVSFAGSYPFSSALTGFFNGVASVFAYPAALGGSCPVSAPPGSVFGTVTPTSLSFTNFPLDAPGTWVLGSAGYYQVCMVADGVTLLQDNPAGFYVAMADGTDFTGLTVPNNDGFPPIGDQFTYFGGLPPITFGPAPTIVFGGTGTVSASGASAGYPITFSSLTPGVCTISDTTVTGVTAGTCTIAADQAANASYPAATQVTQSFNIAKAGQTITFGAAPTVAVGGTGAVSATGGASGNPVTFTSQTTVVCTVSGTTLTGSTTVTGISPGTCTIAADQAGNANYAAAPQVTQSFSIGHAVSFYTLPPCRVLDTRNPTGSLGAPSLQPGAIRTFDVTASTCGIPATAKAISVNLAVTGPVGQGHLTLYPGDAVQAPFASTINFSANQTRANNAVLPLASDGSGTINVLAGTGGTVDFILDVNGYFQ